ncbi:unnamed protein product, partial [Nesidiocoris tenuis]
MAGKLIGSQPWRNSGPQTSASGDRSGDYLAAQLCGELGRPRNTTNEQHCIVRRRTRGQCQCRASNQKEWVWSP